MTGPANGLTLNDLPLEELLPHLERRAATGTLSAETRHHRKKLYLVDGRLAGVSSTNPRELLGHFLVGWGAVTEEQVNQAITLQEKLGTPLGRILERLGAVDGDTLEAALRAQAQEAVLELFLVRPHDQRFLEGVVPTNRPLALDLPIQPVVLEGLRRRERIQELERTLGGLDVIPARTGVEPDDTLSARELHMLGEIDGSRDLDAIALAAHAVPFHVAELVARGVADGLLTIAAAAEPGSLPSTDELLATAEEALARGDLRTCWRTARRLRNLPLDDDEDRHYRSIALGRDIEAALARKRISGMLIPRLRLDATASAADLDPEEAFVLTRVNDAWSLRQIQRVTPIDELGFGLIVDTLVNLGLIELRHPKGGPAGS